MGKEVKACIRCASKNLRWEPNSLPATGNGMRIMGATEGASSIAYTCLDCGYAGNPMIFSSEEDRLKFLELKNNDAKANKKPENDARGVKACMGCGSTFISPQALRRHSLQAYICEECGYVGGCALFETEQQRHDYTRQKKKNGSG